MSWFRTLLTVGCLVIFGMQRLVRVAAAAASSSRRCMLRSNGRFAFVTSSYSPRHGTTTQPFFFSTSTACTLWPRSFSTAAASSSSNEATSANDFFASTNDTFESMGVSSLVLLQRLKKLGLERPSAVQASAYDTIVTGGDVTMGAETGSGKTLAYLLPLINDVLEKKQQADENGYCGYDYARAVILVPNKELVQQVVRMAEPLCGGQNKCLVWGTLSDNDSFVEDEEEEEEVDDKDVVRLAILPGGLKAPEDFAPFRNSIGLGGKDAPVDIVISTPASFGPFGLKPKHIDLFADIQTLVIDEADMLLDGGYLRALENCLMGFRRADKLDAAELGVGKTQHVFSAATLPDMGLRSVDAYLQKKFPNATRVTMAGMHNARHYGLRDSTVWMEAEGKKERMEQLVELMKKPSSKGGLKGEKVMVFLNSVEDVEGANNALDRAGIDTVPYHGKIALKERTANLDRFRRYSAEGSNDSDAVPVLVCTDLASRGLDVPGVTAIVQLQFALNVVAHLHRMGRCGRAGKRNGRGIIFYGGKEKELVDIVRNAEVEQERMMLEGDVEELQEDVGKVKEAFSRKRGFTKKRKKARRKGQAAAEPAET